MNTKYQEVLDSFKKVAEFFGEDPMRATPEQVFGIITQFVDLFKVQLLEVINICQECSF